jgi:peroxiredoxin Q/BCP
LNYPILSDPEKKVANSYGLLASGRQFPSRWTFYIGKDGKITHIDKKVKARQHGEDLAKKLEELGVAKKKKKR